MSQSSHLGNTCHPAHRLQQERLGHWSGNESVLSPWQVPVNLLTDDHRNDSDVGLVGSCWGCLTLQYFSEPRQVTTGTPVTLVWRAVIGAVLPRNIFPTLDR